MYQTIKYQVISASGNPTAIIYGRYSPTLKQIINQKIFAENKIVEQIGYLYKENKNYKFEMMGDEFSANGCRAAAFSILKFNNGKINFKTSGTKKTIKVSIGKDKISTLSIPYSFQPKKIISSNIGFLIKMFGNYLLIIEKNENFKLAKRIVKKYFKNQSAVGIMFIKKINTNKIKLVPIFFVRKTGTLIKETACGSGSIATAIYLSYKNKKSFRKLEIKQPSGESIFVFTNYKSGKINQIKIWGPTKYLGVYKLKPCENKIK